MSATLDQIDRRIVEELQLAPRITILALAGRIGVSRQLAQQRLSRLIDEGILRVFGLVDPALVGRPLLLKLRVTLAHSIRTFGETLAADPRTHWVTLLSSGDQVIATASLGHPADISDFLDQVVRSQPAVESVSTDLITGVYSPAPDGDVREPWLTGGDPGEFDPLDMAIIERLREDGRVGFTRLGQLVGLSTASARQRALRLIDSGTVQLNALADPEALGLAARAELHLRVRGNSMEIARRIAALPHANYVCRTAGSRDIHAEFYCADDEELLTAASRARELPDVLDGDLYRYADVLFANPAWA